jgi:hypothetical protein
MAYTVPVVSYATTLDGTYTALTGIQSVSINRGRKRFQDPYGPTSCSIELIPANSYSTPLEVGQYIDVRVSNSASARAYFTGRISDVERDYSFPYNSGTGAAPADRIIITAYGAMGAIGQTGQAVYISSYTADAREVMINLLEPLTIFMDIIISVSGPTDPYNKLGVSATIPAGTTETNLNLLNYCARAGQAFIDEIDMERNDIGGDTFQVNAYKSSSRTWTFSDSTTGTGIYKYTGINYLSGAESTFNEVRVEGYDTALTPQIENSGVGSPYNSLDYRTQLDSTTQMNSLAGYLLITQNETDPTPIVIRTSTLVADGVESTTYMPITGSPIDDFWWNNLNGAIVTIEFRGTTVEAVVQGVNINFYESHANLEFYLSPFLGAAFTLNSTLLGVLDTNRLGYP